MSYILTCIAFDIEPCLCNLCFFIFMFLRFFLPTFSCSYFWLVLFLYLCWLLSLIYSKYITSSSFYHFTVLFHFQRGKPGICLEEKQQTISFQAGEVFIIPASLLFQRKTMQITSSFISVTCLLNVTWIIASPFGSQEGCCAWGILKNDAYFKMLKVRHHKLLK